jgi:hypothetical protein
VGELDGDTPAEADTDGVVRTVPGVGDAPAGCGWRSDSQTYERADAWLTKRKAMIARPAAVKPMRSGARYRS